MQILVKILADVLVSELAKANTKLVTISGIIRLFSTRRNSSPGNPIYFIDLWSQLELVTLMKHPKDIDITIAIIVGKAEIFCSKTFNTLLVFELLIFPLFFNRSLYSLELFNTFLKLI
jgi:hypothetical protein